jgi:uncharacterized membrane protein
MSAMLPPFVLYRIQIIYLTGVLEILGAIGVWIAPLMTLTRFRLILMLICFLSWPEALEQASIEPAVWRIHRRIGMSGGLLANNLLRETARRIPATEAAQLDGSTQKPIHAKCPEAAPCPGLRNPAGLFSKIAVPWAIATKRHHFGACR